jgi:hypothetical protein
VAQEPAPGLAKPAVPEQRVFQPQLLAAHPVAVGTESVPARSTVAQSMAVWREEREARSRLELAETRTHPFQLAKVYFFQRRPAELK